MIGEQGARRHFSEQDRKARACRLADEILDAAGVRRAVIAVHIDSVPIHHIVTRIPIVRVIHLVAGGVPHRCGLRAYQRVSAQELHNAAEGGLVASGFVTVPGPVEFIPDS